MQATPTVPALPNELDRRGQGRGVAFSFDKNGRKLAFRVYIDRSFRMGLAHAELLVATGQAREVEFCRALRGL